METGVKKKVAIGIVIVDILVLLVVYLAIKRYEGNEKESSQNSVQQTEEETLAFNLKQKAEQKEDGVIEATNGSGNGAMIADNYSEDPTLMNKSSSVRHENTSKVSDIMQFKLRIVDAAGPDKFYNLQRSVDGGITWEIVNDDPFKGYSGVSNGIYFLNEEVGFIAMTRNGGTEGKLFRTSDGGKSFREVTIPEVQAQLTGTITYNPFDTPDVPFREEDKLILFVEQGQDGDYNAGSSAMYVSSDQGQTWNYLTEGQMQQPYNG